MLAKKIVFSGRPACIFSVKKIARDVWNFCTSAQTVLVLFVNSGQAFRCSCGLGRSRASRRPVLSPFLESGCSTLSHMCVAYGRPASCSSLLLPTSIPNCGDTVETGDTDGDSCPCPPRAIPSKACFTSSLLLTP
jgi:hypothetical protein